MNRELLAKLGWSPELIELAQQVVETPKFPEFVETQEVGSCFTSDSIELVASVAADIPNVKVSGT